jgi:superfamily II RNA helicase
MTTPETASAHPRTILDIYLDMLGFPLDDFQLEAIDHINHGKSVVVCAPTGAGKTVIAEFAAMKAMDEGMKLFYTTPLKALSNQKYHDLKARFGEQNVGLLTGDSSINREGQIVVMTTEVFRNMLYGLNEDSTLLDHLGYVVLDECHFMNDADRGTVWEESIVHCPAHVKMVALSATVANADELTAWMHHIHPDCELVYSTFRPVPLHFHYHTGRETLPLFEQGEGGKKRLNHKLKNEQVVKDPKRRNQRFSPYRLIDDMVARKMLPAIFFTFSRRGCDSGMRELGQASLNSYTEREEVKRFIEKFRNYSTSLELTPEAEECLINGVASHHAGLLPAVKLLVEQLFQMNLLKVVFATETLAAGINMPARSTVITAISKRTNEGHRLLRASEFLQMSGRAGRRGMDTVGHVVIVRTPFNTASEVGKLAAAKADPLNSQFTPTYSMVLNLMERHTLSDAEFLINKSFGAFTTDRRTNPMATELQERRDTLDYAENFPCEFGLNLADFEEQLKLRTEISQLNREKGFLKKQLKKFGDAPEVREELAKVESRLFEIINTVEEAACSTCLHFKNHRRVVEKVERLQKQVLRLEDEVEAERNVYWNQFLKLYKLLSEAGYLQKTSESVDNKPTSLGLLTANIRTENELFVAEALREEVFDELEYAELAAVASAMVNDSTRENVQTYVRTSKAANACVRKLFRLAERVQKLQRSYQVQVALPLNPVACGVVEMWARGADWNSLTAATSMDQGDLVRNLRRTADLLRQFAKTPGMPPDLSRTAHEALVAIHREPVKEVELPSDE